MVSDAELQFSVTEPGRLDRSVASLLPGSSRTEVQRWIRAGQVWLDGEVCTRVDQAVMVGAHLVVRPMVVEPMEALPESMELDILFEDRDLLVVNKAAGLVVHPAPGHPGGTLVNGLLAHTALALPEENDGGNPLRPGIVHRLDKDTSGVMVVAKSLRAHRALVDMFRAHDLDREYAAIVRGRLPRSEMTFLAPIGRHPGDRKRFSSKVAPSRGKPAHTQVRFMEPLHGASLVRCRLETGRTHQIRVHLSDAGHPVLGDPVYGSPGRDPLLISVAQELARQALHAQVLGFDHPVTGEKLRFESAVPADFRKAWTALSTD